MKFKINNYITLRLEGSETVIYIADERFRQCKFVIFEVPYKDLSSLDNVNSIDDLLSIKIKNQDSSHLDILNTSPEEKFWVHCSSFQTWAENNYNTSLLDSYLAFPILKKLAEVGDMNAKRVFKEEIGKKLRSGVPQVLRFMIRENYTSYLNQEELLYSALIHEEAAAIEEISKRTHKYYGIVFDFDDLREIFFHIHRNQDDLYNKKYYFSAFKGNVQELELLIDKKSPSIPQALEKLSYLRRMYIYANDLGLECPKFNLYMESLVHLKVFCFGRVILPNIFHNFPKLQSLDIYGDITGLTQLEIDDDVLENLDGLRHNFKNVILKKLV